jgi:hypothetical protein
MEEEKTMMNDSISSGSIETEMIDPVQISRRPSSYQHPQVENLAEKSEDSDERMAQDENFVESGPPTLRR